MPNLSSSATSFAELFRTSGFVKNYKKGVDVVVRNSRGSRYQGNHFGMKRDLPVPADNHRLILVEDMDQSTVGFTVFTDITAFPGDRLVMSLLRDKMKRALDNNSNLQGSDGLRVRGRFLGLSQQHSMVLVGLAGIKAVMPMHDAAGLSMQDIQEKVLKMEESDFYLTRVQRLSLPRNPRANWPVARTGRINDNVFSLNVSVSMNPPPL